MYLVQEMKELQCVVSGKRLVVRKRRECLEGEFLPVGSLASERVTNLLREW